MNDEKKLWSQYFKNALSLPHNKLTEIAIQHNKSGVMAATDCGCGTGSDIQFLTTNGYFVNAFDKQNEAIDICDKRFRDSNLVRLDVASFEDYDYQPVGLLIAHNSLYFANASEFKNTWNRIQQSIYSGGVFAGSFIGYNDDWVKAKPEAMCPVNKFDLNLMFDEFEIIKLVEHNYVGDTVLQKQKNWHTFTVLAVKK